MMQRIAADTCPGPQVLGKRMNRASYLLFRWAAGHPLLRVFNGGSTMKHRIRIHLWHAALLLGVTVCLLAVGVALAAGNIDPTNRWAWSTNAGWINFAPTATTAA